MLEIDNQPTSDAYTDACTLGPVGDALSIAYVVANGAVRAQLAPLLKSETLGQWGPELLLTPQSNTVQHVGGMRFRSAVAGTPARVVAQLFQPADPILGSGTVFTGTLTASGAVTPVAGLINGITGRLGLGAVPQIQAGSGMSGIVRNGVGDFTVSYTTPFAAPPIVVVSSLVESTFVTLDQAGVGSQRFLVDDKTGVRIDGVTVYFLAVAAQ